VCCGEPKGVFTVASCFTAQLATGISSPHLSSGCCHQWHSVMGPYLRNGERGGEKGTMPAGQQWVSDPGLQALLIVPGCRWVVIHLCIPDEDHPMLH